MNVHIILVAGDVLPNLRQMVCVCSRSAKYPVQLHKKNTSEALGASESIKVAAIGFQINPCLILTALSALSVLDPVLAHLLQHMWYKTSQGSGAAWQAAAATARREVVHIL